MDHQMTITNNQSHPASNNNLGNRIKQIRKANKLTQKEFAASLGIAQGFLCAIERGRKKPSETLLIALQHRYNISKSWLSASENTTNTDTAEKPSPHSETQHRAPLVKVTAGSPSAFPPLSADEFISMPDLPANCFAIKYSGDFMAPTIRDGDIIILSPEQTSTPGTIVLLTGKWGDPFLRRCRSRGGEIYYTSDNSAYAPFKSDASTRILGVVISVWRRINI
jgi:SOS-response transcriptional repressor LexA